MSFPLEEQASVDAGCIYARRSLNCARNSPAVRNGLLQTARWRRTAQSTIIGSCFVFDGVESRFDFISSDSSLKLDHVEDKDRQKTTKRVEDDTLHVEEAKGCR